MKFTHNRLMLGLVLACCITPVAFAGLSGSTGANSIPANTFDAYGAASSVAATAVSSVAVTTANGVSGTSSGGHTPSLTLALGAITPSSVNGVTTDSTTNKPVTAATLNGGTLPASLTGLALSGAITGGVAATLGATTVTTLSASTGTFSGKLNLGSPASTARALNIANGTANVDMCLLSTAVDGAVGGATIYFGNATTFGEGYLSYDNASATFQLNKGLAVTGTLSASSGGSTGHATCWKAGGVIGYCSTIVGADGTCTCN